MKYVRNITVSDLTALRYKHWLIDKTCWPDLQRLLSHCPLGEGLGVRVINLCESIRLKITKITGLHAIRYGYGFS